MRAWLSSGKDNANAAFPSAFARCSSVEGTLCAAILHGSKRDELQLRFLQRRGPLPESDRNQSPLPENLRSTPVPVGRFSVVRGAVDRQLQSKRATSCCPARSGRDEPAERSPDL